MREEGLPWIFIDGPKEATPPIRRNRLEYMQGFIVVRRAPPRFAAVGGGRFAASDMNFIKLCSLSGILFILDKTSKTG